MTTRIIFNGQEYAGTEAMPESVRDAYLKALALLKDADANGIPDVVETGSVDRVIGVEPPRSDASVGGLDTAQSMLGVLLAFLAGFTLVFSVSLMFAIGGGREHLAGRLVVAIAAWLFLGWLDTHASRLAERRRALLGPDSPGYRRFVVWSAAGLFLAAALLLGLAWFLPGRGSS
jgi:hypothetical protein